jgi:hypothetical protein
LIHFITYNNTQRNALQKEEEILQIIIFKLNERLKDEIMMGMAELYHISQEKYNETYNDWLVAQQRVIEAHELLNKRKNKLDTIKQFIRNEWEVLIWR